VLQYGAAGELRKFRLERPMHTKRRQTPGKDYYICWVPTSLARRPLPSQLDPHQSKYQLALGTHLRNRIILQTGTMCMTKRKGTRTAGLKTVVSSWDIIMPSKY
jgi:hypothetical protein